MITPSPTAEQSLFTPEQRRRLGEVYCRILSWRQEDIQKPSSSALPNHLVLPDDASSEDHSKGGIHG